MGVPEFRDVFNHVKEMKIEESQKNRYLPELQQCHDDLEKAGFGIGDIEYDRQERPYFEIINVPAGYSLSAYLSAYETLDTNGDDVWIKENLPESKIKEDVSRFCHFCNWSGYTDEDTCPECGHKLDVARMEEKNSSDFLSTLNHVRDQINESKYGTESLDACPDYNNDSSEEELNKAYNFLDSIFPRLSGEDKEKATEMMNEIEAILALQERDKELEEGKKNKCPKCGKPQKEDTEGDMRYCQGHSLFDKSIKKPEYEMEEGKEPKGTEEEEMKKEANKKEEDRINKEASEKIEKVKETSVLNEDETLTGPGSTSSNYPGDAMIKPAVPGDQGAADEPMVREPIPKEEEEELNPEGEKEYLGNKGQDMYFYFVTVPAEDGTKDIQIQDANDEVVYSAKENQLPVEDIAEFLWKGISELELANIATEIVTKYLMPEEKIEEPNPEEGEAQTGEEQTQKVKTETPVPSSVLPKSGVGESLFNKDEYYNIVRFRENGTRRVIQRHVTKEEAQVHCNDPETSGEGWFDGYVKESKADELMEKFGLKETIIKIDELLEKFKLNERNFKTKEEFIEYLEKTLIPDLYASGQEGTAEDFEEAIEWMIGPSDPMTQDSGDLLDEPEDISGPEYDARNMESVNKLIEKYGLNEFEISRGRTRFDVKLILSMPKGRNRSEVFSNWITSLVLKQAGEVQVEAGEVVKVEETKVHGATINGRRIIEQGGEELFKAPKEPITKEEKPVPGVEDTPPEEVQPEVLPPVEPSARISADSAALGVPDERIPNEPVTPDYSTAESAEVSIRMDYPEEPFTSTSLSYADSLVDEPTVYGAIRNLHWNGIYTNAETFLKQTKIVGQYNEFSPEVAQRIVDKFGEGSKYRLAREGSVAVYVTVRDSDKQHSIEAIRDLTGADEVDQTGNPGEVRIWFD